MFPPFARAMMDGIAFSSKDAAFFPKLRIAGLHAAGDGAPRALEAGEAWEIMTGAAVPEDCDTVVPYEDLTEDGRIGVAYEPGHCIHAAGLDARVGDVLVPPHTRMGTAELAIAASVGMCEVEVFRRPRIAVITTGDEAVAVDAVPEPWQIRRSNGPMLVAALTRLGMPPVLHEHVADDVEVVGRMIDMALAAAELVIICGGISKGRKDHVRTVVEERLGAPLFHGVMQKPGKPLAYWGGKKKIFALPGNPVSVLATFTRFVMPALCAMEGRRFAPWRMAVEGAKPLPRFSWLLTVARDASGRLVPRPPGNSGDHLSIAGCEGIVEIPGEPDFTPGQDFPFFPFP
jgi:molybdopterin molybdotransferase